MRFDRPMQAIARCLGIALVAAVGCTGQIADPIALGPGAERAPEGTQATVPDGVVFELPNDKLSLLPFDVRMNVLASVVGVPLDDPMFTELYEERYELGDHDYSRGTAPDLSWTASRIVTWLRALRPVCASGAMRARYPSLREELDALVLAAYGRRASAADFDAYDAAVATAGLTPDEEHRAMCLAMLSSTELVAR